MVVRPQRMSFRGILVTAVAKEEIFSSGCGIGILSWQPPGWVGKVEWAEQVLLEVLMGMSVVQVVSAEMSS